MFGEAVGLHNYAEERKATKINTFLNSHLSIVVTSLRRPLFLPNHQGDRSAFNFVLFKSKFSCCVSGHPRQKGGSLCFSPSTVAKNGTVENTGCTNGHYINNGDRLCVQNTSCQRWEWKERDELTFQRHAKKFQKRLSHINVSWWTAFVYFFCDLMWRQKKKKPHHLPPSVTPGTVLLPGEQEIHDTLHVSWLRA